MDKKIKYLLMFAAIAALAPGLTACSSEDDLAMTESGQSLGDVVRAQITISIPTAANGTTRQASEIVNSEGTIEGFRGITFIKLFPSSLTTSAFKDATAKTIGDNISLTNLVIPLSQTVSNYIPGKKLLKNSNSVLYGDVQLRTGTKSFLFYGMSIGKGKTYNTTQQSYSVDDKFVNGYLNENGISNELSDVSNLSFSLQPITTNDKSNDKRTGIITYLNAIASTNGWSTTTDVTMKDVYTSFTGMQAGSSTNLKVVIWDLYSLLKDNKDELSKAICKSIKDSEISSGVKYVTINETDKNVTFNEAIDGYPSTSDNLPDGAAVLSWNGTKFSYVTKNVSTSEMTVSNLESYVFPAALYYWGHSDILTSQELKHDLYKENKDDNTPRQWTDIANTTNFNEGPSITSKTRSVVLTNPINYAVGRLDINVKATASGTSPSTLTDAGTGNAAVNVDISKLKLTGILIGGQKPVDWKFEPKTGSECTIYDNILISQSRTEGLDLTTTGGATVMNSTLVLESPGTVSNVVDKVKVALEFVNDDQDFRGATGIVAKGTKFYLVGELDASKVSNSATGGKVFKQDYITLANFTINNLKSAINTIPDLRNPQVELGLSVDLSWKTGDTYDITIE